MPLYFFLCLLKNQELRNTVIEVETLEGAYTGYLRGVTEQSLEIEEDGSKNTVYVVLSKIVGVEMSKMCCSLESKDTVKCFSQFGVAKQEYYEHHPNYQRYLTYQLMKKIKEQEKPEQLIKVVLVNGKKRYFKVQDILKELEEITLFYTLVMNKETKRERIVIMNNEYISAIEVLRE